MPALRGFVLSSVCFGRVIFGHSVVSALSVCRNLRLLRLQESRPRILSRHCTMPPRKKAAAKMKVTEEEGKEATSQKETKKAKMKATEEEGKEATSQKETKKAKMKVTEEESKEAAPQKETKKRGRSKKEENGDDEETASGSAEPPPKLVKKVSDGLTSMDFCSNAKTEDGRNWNLKIASWNINGVRAWLNKDGLSYLSQEKPDVLCVQEIKCSESKLPPELKVDGYKAFWVSAEKEGYAGTGMYSKTDPISVKYGIGKAEHDNEGRVITAEFEKFYLVTSYVPNSGQGLVRLKYRTNEWDEDFTAYLKDLDAKKPVILCGDLNVAHLDIDLKNPKGNKRNAGFTNEERAGFGKLLEEGFIDSFRTLYPEKEEAYTFWSNFRQAREKNIGWRLDYFVLSERLKKDMCDSIIRTHVMGSDHCPIVLLLAL